MKKYELQCEKKKLRVLPSGCIFKFIYFRSYIYNKLKNLYLK